MQGMGKVEEIVEVFGPGPGWTKLPVMDVDMDVEDQI